MEKKQNVPALRFQGFSGEWERKSLGNITEIIMGQSPDGINYFDKPCGKILVQGNADLKDGWVVPRIWTTQITKTAKAGDLIMSVRAPAGAMGKTAYDVVIGRGVAAIKGNDFIYHLLVNLNQKGYWKNFAAGSTFEALNGDNIRQAVVSITNLMEQSKIGEFFETIDRKISSVQYKIQKLQQFRQAMLTKLFPREGAEEPELRFRGFSGPWAQGVLGNVAKRVIVGLATSVTPYYRETGIPIFRNLNIKKNYLDDQDILFLDKEYADCQKSKQIHTDDVLTVRTGYIGISCVVPPKYDGCLTFTTLITTPDTTVLNGKYLSQYLNTPFGMESMQAVTTQGGRNNLNVNDFVKVVIKYPDLDEQIKIAEFLTSLDTYISLQQKKLERMQRLKAALLEKMFV